jgi:hypothetical protein
MLSEKETGPLLFKVFKSLHGLKAGAMEWYIVLSKLLLSLGYVFSWWDACLFYKLDVDGKLERAVAVHVDDLLVCSSPELTVVFLEVLRRTNLDVTAPEGSTRDYLGVRIEQNLDEGFIRLSQPGFLASLLFDDCALSATDVSNIPHKPRLFDGDDDSPLLDATSKSRFMSRLMKVQWLSASSYSTYLSCLFF